MNDNAVESTDDPDRPDRPDRHGPDPTARFSNRVAHYVKHRPGYPDALLNALQHDLALSAGSSVADVGSGTGISSDLLTRIGCRVYAIEPNAEMRRAAEARFAQEPRFHSIAARAEATTLPDASVDAITAGQAFHWFDRAKTRREFARILRPGGMVALFWNTRRTDRDPFLVAYERLLQQFGTDYPQVDHRHVNADTLRAFFGGAYQSRVFAHEQIFDFEGIKGRLLSSSYAPGPEHPNHAGMLTALRQIFEAHHEAGQVRIAYDTELFFGTLHPDKNAF
jgi:ubiquinone/menaquinone biosynthesis C-methylase UbiE